MRETAAGQRDSTLPNPSEEHGFIGFHLLANYTGCNARAIKDLNGLRKAMASAAQASGATVLKTAEHVFDTDGFSQVLLLSESHASIHTYPEVCSCFLDLFTCGTTCRPEKFEEIMCDYLQPTGVARQIVVRDKGLEPEPSADNYEPMAESFSTLQNKMLPT